MPRSKNTSKIKIVMETLPISRINLDNIYSFSFPEKLGKLTESIKKVGLLHPVILTTSYNIICGRRRVISSLNLNLAEIPAIILDKKLSVLELFKINLEDNLSTRTLNIIEKTIILNKLKKNFGVPEKIIVKDYLPRLEIPKNIKYLEKFFWLDKLPIHLKRDIVNKDISLDILDKLMNWPQDVINNILPLFLSFKFGRNKILQLITILNDISLRDNQPVDKLFKSDVWLNIYNNPSIPIFQKGLWLRKFLTARRYPIHTETKNKIRKLLDKIELPHNISVLYDELLTLENNNINFKLICKHREDLKIAGQRLIEISESKELKEILDLIKV